MTKPFEKALLYSLLPVIIFGWALAARAQKTSEILTTALQEARETGISESILKPLLALGYEKQFEVSGMADLLPILAQCQRESLPLEPFLNKIAEGISKSVSGAQIEQVLRKRLEDYRFTRSLITEKAGLAGKAEPLSPESYIRFTETLYCGLSRDNLTHLLRVFPDTPLPVVSRGAEVLASLKQVHFDPELAEQIVNTGMKQGYFTTEHRELSRVVAAAKRKGLQDSQIATAAMSMMGKGGSRRDFTLHLGITDQDLHRHSPQEEKSKPASGGQGTLNGTGSSGKGTAGDSLPTHGAAGLGLPPTGPVATSDPAKTSGQIKGSASLPGAGDADSSEVAEILDAGKEPDAVSDPSAGLPLEPGRGSSHLATSPVAGSSNADKASNPVAKSGLSQGSTQTEGPSHDHAADPGRGASTVGNARPGQDITEIDSPGSPGQHQQKKPSLRFAASGTVVELDPEAMTLNLELDSISNVSGGCSGLFTIRENVTVKAESSDVGRFDLGLDDLAVEGDYLKVLGRQQPDGDCLIAHIVLCVDGPEGSGGTGSGLHEGPAPESGERATFAAAGTIAAINPDGPALTLLVDKANRSLEEQLGRGPFEFMISDDVRIKSEGVDPLIPYLTLEDLAAGGPYVRVFGERKTQGVYLIHHIVVDGEE